MRNYEQGCSNREHTAGTRPFSQSLCFEHVAKKSPAIETPERNVLCQDDPFSAQEAL